jgi:cbb3-type cytochrome oxidase subunit 3
MRELFSDQTLGMWAAIACVLFLALFAGMLLWVFRPGSREQYRDAARLPLDDSRLPGAR